MPRQILSHMHSNCGQKTFIGSSQSLKPNPNMVRNMTRYLDLDRTRCAPGQNMYSGLFYFYHPNETNKHLMSFDTKVRRQEGRKRKQSSHRPKALLVQNCYPHKQSWKCIFFPAAIDDNMKKQSQESKKHWIMAGVAQRRLALVDCPQHGGIHVTGSNHLRAIFVLYSSFAFSYTTRCMFETVHIVLCQHGNVASTSLWRRLIMLCFIVARKKQH